VGWRPDASRALVNIVKKRKTVARESKANIFEWINFPLDFLFATNRTKLSCKFNPYPKTGCYIGNNIAANTFGPLETTRSFVQGTI